MTQPDGPLRAARAARSWSQARAVEELSTLALDRGVPVAAPASLKTQLSRWENQHAVPDEHYRALLCALYDSTEAELGLSGPPPADPEQPELARAHLLTELAEAAALDEQGIALLRTQARATRQLDHRLGTPASEGPAQAQLSYLERVLAHATKPQIRRELAYLVADNALLVSEHARDRMRTSEAWRHLETARGAAHQVGSSELASYAMAKQAVLLLEIGEYKLGTDLVNEAAKLPETAPATLRAWLTACRGYALAAGGALEPAHSAYAAAENQLHHPGSRVDLNYSRSAFLTFDLPAFHRHRGRARLLLHEGRPAIEDLELALEGGGNSTREVAGIHVDLAYAHGEAGHSSSASEHASRARDLATRIGSVRLAQLLDERQTSFLNPTQAG